MINKGKFYDSETGKMVRGKVKEALHSKGYSGVANALNAIGFGEGGNSGGARAGKGALKHSLL